MPTDPRIGRFESTVLVHLDAAWNLARWLLRDPAHAEDAVQEACLKALRGFEQRTGPSAKAWFMTIVRNCCMDALRSRRRHAVDDSYEDEMHGTATLDARHSPEAAAIHASEVRSMHAAIAELPLEFREVLILRELEELSYKEISAIVRVPMGTVMSRLSRARDLLAEQLGAGRMRRRG